MQCNTWNRGIDSGKSKQSRRKNITKSETRSQLLFETSLFHKNDLGPDMTGEHNSKVAHSVEVEMSCCRGPLDLVSRRGTLEVVGVVGTTDPFNYMKETTA